MEFLNGEMMKRNVRMKDISDGRFYGPDDMVLAGCDDCAGCSKCCHLVGDTIKLDPFDVHRLMSGLHCSFEELMQNRIELHVVDGIIRPNLKMDQSRNACSFLDDYGRCSIHTLRPGFCRIFPLGRYFENGSFRYFLQIHECYREMRKLVKVRKFIDTPDLEKNTAYINHWHDFLNTLEEKLTELTTEENNQLNLYLLKIFYITPYDETKDFYTEFEQRLAAAGKDLAL